MSQVPSGAPAPDDLAGLPDELAAWIAAAPAVLAATRGAVGWTAAGRQRALAAFDRVANIVTVGRAHVVSAEAEAGTWGRMGDRDMAGFLGRESHQGRSAGAAAVDQAATLRAMPTVAEALVDGPVKHAKGKESYREGRAGAHNIVPSSTGAAIAVTKAIP